MLNRETRRKNHNQQGKQGGEVSVIIHPQTRLVKSLFFFSEKRRLTVAFC